MAETKPPVFTTFGEMLRHLRQRAQITQEELGLAVGYSRAHIARLESNQRMPDAGAVRARFFEPLGITPDSSDAVLLVKLAQSARAVPALPSEETEASSAQVIPNNLPCELTSFIGREQALSELERLLPTLRLLTLTGTGGTGKTRLALKLAERVMSDYPDGVWLVELAPLSDPAQVPQAILAALGRPDVPAQQATETLIHWLKAKRVLLLIDNCEHVIDACAQVIDGLLRGCQSVTVLATSRESLSIAGEMAWRVPSLQVPNAISTPALEAMRQYESMRLFVERAAFVQPAFALNADNTPVVLRICTRLDGIPLAIELAAARIASFSPETIAKRLDESFKILAGGSRTALPRQQTLQATIEWSYRLLSEQEKLLLCRLSVFAGGWTLEAGEFVGQGNGIEKEQIFDLLDTLVSKSLIERDDADVETRYMLLESVRQFALNTLSGRDEVATLRDRHLDCFLEFGVDAQKGLEGKVPVDQVKLIQRLRRDFDNIRRASDWAIDSQQIEKAWDLLERYFDLFIALTAQMELIERLRAALDHPAAPQNTRRKAHMLFRLGMMQHRHSLFEDHLATVRKVEAIGLALNSHEILTWATGGFYADAYEREDVAAMRLFAEQWMKHAVLAGTFSEAELQEAERSIQLELHFQESNYQQVLVLEKEFYDKYAHSDNKLNTSGVERDYGMSLLRAGYLDEASDHLRVSLIDNHSLGDVHAVAACLGSLAALSLARNDLLRCAKLLGASEFFQEQAGVVLHWADLKVIAKTTGALREQLDELTIRKEWEEGRAMTLDQAMAYALE